MKIIATKISYDSITSRFPGVVPSLVDYWEVPEVFHCGDDTTREKYYSYSTAVIKAAEYNLIPVQLEYGAEFIGFDINNILEFTKGNYGLIPSDVIIPEDIAELVTDYTDFYVNIPNGEGDFYDLTWPVNPTDPHYEGRKIVSGETNTEVKILTYETLNEWYSFFRRYYELVNGPDYSRIYENAVDYYDKEIKVKNSVTKAYYEELDRVFKARGGEEMYKWMTNNCFIQYNIPAKFSDEWSTTYLPFSDALKWYYWFRERAEKYTHAENLEDCKNTDDCCDCSEYIKLGGYGFYKDLKDWVENLKIDNSYATNSASITIPISFTNSIDDLGEYSIFSNEWKEETDYHNTLIEKMEHIIQGTVIHQPYRTDSETGDKTVLNDTYIIKDDNASTKGYEYNEYYENVFKEDDWLNYTDYYINHNPYEFASNGLVNGRLEEITGYTYSPINGKVIYNPGDRIKGSEYDERITQLLSVKIVENVCVNGATYEVIDGKYVEMCYSDGIAGLEYRKGKLQVFKEGNLEYVVFNGKRKYVVTDESNNERVYFLDEYGCNDSGCPVLKGKYVIYDNALYLITELENVNDLLILDDYDTRRIYPVFDGYFTFGSITLYISNSSILIQDELIYDEDTNIYQYSFRNLTERELNILGVKEFEIVRNADNVIENVKVWYKFETQNCRIVSGYTDTKVELLRRKEITVDDLGNELPGHFRSVIDLNRIRLAYDGDVIDPTHVLIDGESVETNSVRFSRYNTPYDECTLDILYKVGEVSDLKPITNMKNKVEEIDEETGEVIGYHYEDIFNGNIIESIEFYYRDIYGNRVTMRDEEQRELGPFMADNDNALEVIEECRQAFEETEREDISDVMYCDITYYIGAVISKVEERDGKTVVGWHYELCQNFHKGVRYIDTLFVTKEVGTYYLDNSRTFTFNYYKLSQHVNSIQVTDLNADLTWDFSTYFEIQPLLYKYTPDGADYVDEGIFGIDSDGNERWSHNNGAVISPLVRREYNLAASYPQNVNSNIYIDRGINAAYEKLLKLQEVRTMEALENLANSSSVSGFKINDY